MADASSSVKSGCISPCFFFKEQKDSLITLTNLEYVARASTSIKYVGLNGAVCECGDWWKSDAQAIHHVPVSPTC